MKKNVLSNSELLDKIFRILIERGIKATTMDDVARILSISKRTLYEIFESKREMVRAVMANHSLQMQKFVSDVFQNSDNVLEAILTISNKQRAEMAITNVKFFRDLDMIYPEMKKGYEESRPKRYDGLMKILEKGVQEGVFRKDIDYRIYVSLIEIHMEALKRMEEYFPSNITIDQVFDVITRSFLRNIASKKGHRMLDELLT